MEITKEVLEKLYIQDKKSCREVGLVLCKSPAEICRQLKIHGIKGRPCTTKGLQAWNKGKKMTETSRENLSNSMLGKKLSPEHKVKVIKTLRYGQKGEKNPNWKKGRYSNPEGYVYLRLPNHPNKMSNHYYAEHRYVVEQKIGRFLTKWEHVHHLNGVKHDNRPENLELVNGHTHNLITMLTNKINKLEEENARLRVLLA